MRIVDTRGLLCPAPLIAVKKALKETGEGESLKILTDNKTSYNNLYRFLKDNNRNFQVTESGGVWSLILTTNGETQVSDINEYSPHFEKGDFIVAVTSDKMGEGDENLGKLLLCNFIKALKDLDKLPRKIVFYNRGVLILTDDSGIIEDLRDLEQMGVELLLCATCVNYYHLEEKICAGILSDMYTIAGEMAKAGSVIRP